LRRAERNGVKLPTKFGFSFGSVRTQLKLEDKDAKKLPMLATQVLDIRDICRALFDAKVHELIHVKRASTISTDNGNEFIGRKPAKNDAVGTMSYPYEITFQAFSAELGAAMANLANSPQMMIVKWINCEHGSGSAATDPNAGQNPDAAAGTQPAMDPRMMMMMRYGMRPGMMMPQQPQAETSAPTRKGPALDEKPLRIILAVDVVRKALPGAVVEKPAGGSAGRGRPGAGGEGAAPAADGAAPAADGAAPAQ